MMFARLMGDGTIVAVWTLTWAATGVLLHLAAWLLVRRRACLPGREVGPVGSPGATTRQGIAAVRDCDGAGRELPSR